MGDLKNQLYHNLLQTIALYLLSLILYHFHSLLYFVLYREWKPMTYFLQIGKTVGYYIPYILAAAAIAAITLALLRGCYVLQTLSKILKHRKDNTK